MASNRNNYQYETSPRKLTPEYEPKKQQQKKQVKTKQTNTKNKQKVKKQLKPHVKTVLYILAGFILLFALSFQNSLIDKKFNEKESLKQQLATLQKENQQTQISIQNSLNMANVERSAKDMFGMKKLDDSQKVYISLPKKDYVEPATEEVVIEMKRNWWQKILDNIMEFIN